MEFLYCLFGIETEDHKRIREIRERVNEANRIDRERKQAEAIQREIEAERARAKVLEEEAERVREAERARAKAREEAAQRERETERARTKAREEAAQREREAERVRAKAREEAAQREREEALRIIRDEFRSYLVVEIDEFIRSRNKFDSRAPLSYFCGINAIEQDANVMSILEEFNEYLEVALTMKVFLSAEYNFNYKSSNQMVAVVHLTPFQGELEDGEHLIGYFKCGKCKVTWVSVRGKVNNSLPCNGCQSKCYPWRQETFDQDELDELIEQSQYQLEKAIDGFIRSRKQFDSRAPLSYFCSINSFEQNADICEYLNELNQFEYYDVSLREFISSRTDRFTLKANQVAVTKLTPFQGAENHRFYGYFKCGKCKKAWESAASWTNKWQQCRVCESKCYPWKQTRLEIRETRDDDDNETVVLAPHDSGRCEKCIQLGRLCLPRRYYDFSGKYR